MQLRAPDGTVLTLPDSTPPSQVREIALAYQKGGIDSVKQLWAKLSAPKAPAQSASLDAALSPLNQAPGYFSLPEIAAIGQGLADPIEGAAALASLVPGVSRAARAIPGFPAVERGAEAMRREAASAPGTRFVTDLANPLNWVVPEAAGAAVPADLALGVARPAVAGAVAALEQPPSGKATPGGEAWQAALGAAGGSILDSLGRVIGHAVSPAKQALIDQGVRLTPGAQLGWLGRELASVAGQLPGIDEPVIGGNLRMIDDYNRAMYAKALAPIGKKPGAGVGNEGLEMLRREIGQVYDSAIPGLSFRVNPGFAADLQRARASLPTSGAQAAFDDALYRAFPHLASKAPAWKEITGEELATRLSQLRSAARSLRDSPDAERREAGIALRDIARSIAVNSTEREPGAKAARNAADFAYQHYRIIRNAAKGGAMEGRFTPAHLLAAIEKMAPEVQAKEGRALMQREAQAALRVIGDPALKPSRGVRGGLTEALMGYLLGTHPAGGGLAAALGAGFVGGHTETGMNLLRRATMSPERTALGALIRKGVPAVGIAAGKGVGQ